MLKRSRQETELKFRKAYVPNPTFRFSPGPILQIADDLVSVCETPIFDDLVGQEHRDRFENKIVQKMNDFDPDKDVIVFYGDPLIFAMMIMYVTIFIAEDGQAINIARWSTKQEKYLIRPMTDEAFPELAN